MRFGEYRPALAVPLAVSLCAFPPSEADLFVTLPRADVQTRRVDRSAISISANGGFIAFSSYAPLRPEDANRGSDIYVLDRGTGMVSLETPPSQHALAGDASGPSISADGRFLVFGVLDRASGVRVAALRDRGTGVSRILRRDGVSLEADLRGAKLSAGAEVVVFSSSATTFVDGPDANGRGEDVFAVDLASMRFERISVDSAGRQPGAGASFEPAVNADGRFIAFTSTASLGGNAGSGPRAGVYIRDRRGGTTTPICVSVDAGAANGSCYEAAISADGRYVAFVSDATNLVKGRDRNHAPDVFVRDMVRNVTELISRNVTGGAGSAASLHPAISDDGRFVVFQSEASDLICAGPCSGSDRDINLVADIFVRDRQSGLTRRVSRAREPWMEPSLGPAVDGTGAVIAFSSQHPTDATDDREDYDLFIWNDGKFPLE